MRLGFQLARIMLSLLVVSGLVVPSMASSTEQLQQLSAELLRERIAYWYERDRNDRLAELLEQLLMVHPNHPALLEIQALLALRQNRSQDARDYYQQLQSAWPNEPATARLHEMLGLDENRQQLVSDAELLYLAGRYQESADMWQQAFPEPPRTLSLALNYWQARGQLGEYDAAYQALLKLQQDNPYSTKLELALLRLRYQLNQIQRDDLEQLLRLTQDQVFGQEALGLAIRMAYFYPPTASDNRYLVQALYRLFPDNAEVAELQQLTQQAVAEQQSLANDPFYQRQLRGLAALAAGQPLQAERWLRDALPQRGKDVRVLSGLGYATMRQGRHDEALAWFRKAQQLEPEVNEWQAMVATTTFWRDYGVFNEQLEQANFERATIALNRLRSHPEGQDQQPLLQDLAANLWAAQAEQLQADGKLQQAHDYWLKAYALSPSNPWLVADVADSLVVMGQLPEAEQIFAELVRAYPSAESWYAYSLFYSGRDNLEQALAAALQIPEHSRSLAVQEHITRLERSQQYAAFQQDWRRELARKPQLLGQVAADDLADYLAVMADGATPADRRLIATVSAVLERLPADERVAGYAEAADFAEQVGARADQYRWATAALQSKQQPNIWFIEDDDWRTPGLQSQALRAAEQSQGLLYLGYDRSDKSGTAGISALASQTLMLELRMPFSERSGHWFVKLDPTYINAGAADLSNNYWRDRFGSGLVCELTCPTGLQEKTDAFGVAVGIGAEYENWRWDIGRSPIGFNKSQWLGGLGYDFELGALGSSLTLERRIQTSTFTSFAAMQDPYSQQQWGAVTRTGINWGLSWDQGGTFGWWGSSGYNWYRGHNVADNSNWYLYSGGYARAYESEPLSITVGLTALTWGFAHDYGETTLGQGHYYSPKLYQSLSLPLTLSGRIDRFSYLLRGSLGYSSSNLGDEPFYPHHPLLQQQAENLVDGTTPYFAASSGGGVSRSFSGVFEYKLSRKLYIGLSLELIRSDTFAPNQGLIYLRYHFGDFDLPVAKPPAPPAAYVDR